MFHRNIGRTVLACDAVQKVFTCSTGDVLSGADITGAVIDRLGLGGATGINVLNKSDNFEVAEPFILAWTTAGTTAADQRLSIKVRLQHGDSSGGGDQADYPAAGGTSSTSAVSTNFATAARNYFTSGMSTQMQNWTTGAYKFSNNPGGYSLSGAKRFIRPVGVITKPFGATSTAAGTADQLNALLGVNFRGSGYEPPSLDTTSTSTSTST